MTKPAYGIVINESFTGPLPVQAGDFSVIGLLLPADDADVTVFPLNKPIAFNSTDPDYLGKAGTGDFVKALNAINNQLAVWQSAARVVAVLVARGETLAETMTNLVGAQATFTGLYAFLKSGSLNGVIPRLIGSPGYTGATTVDGQGHTIANPLVAAMPAALNALLATAYVGAVGDGVVANTLAWRETLASDRLNPIDGWVVPGSGVGYSDGAAEALGLQVAVDFQHAGIPGWSISGQQVAGIAGLKNYYSFSLTDGATEGQELLAQQVSVIEPGAIGSDTAIAASGFVVAGVWNASDDPRAWFVNKRRMKDFVHLALVKAIRLRLGVDNVTPHAVQAVLNDMVVLGSYLLSKQISIGFKVSFVASENSPTELAQGRFVVGFANETPAPITVVTVDSTDDPDALTVELATIIAQSSTIAPQYLTA
jgi:uncharacterized protein